MDDAPVSPEDIAAQNPFTQVPIEVTVSVGRARPLVRDLLRLKADAVLPLRGWILRKGHTRNDTPAPV